MERNQKLTALLTGREIGGTATMDATTSIGFMDGSRMTIKTGGSQSSRSASGTVKSVRQQGTELKLEFEDGETLTIQTAEAVSSVMVRNQDGVMEYAD
jgi:hypothetical protein